MKCTSLKIRSFRSFSNEDDVEISFIPRINTIVGKNNVGKSAIFHSLRYILGEISYDPKDNFRGILEDVSSVELKAKLDNYEMSSFLSILLQSFRISSKNQKEIIDFQKQKFPDITFSRKGNHSTLKLGSFFLNGTNIGSTSTASGLNIGLFTKDLALALKTTYLESLLQEKFKRARAQQTQEEKLFIGSRINIEDFFNNLLFSNLKIFSEFRQRPSGSSEAITESYDGSQVASVLDTLKNGDTNQIKKWRRIKQFFSDFYPTLILDVRKPPGQNPTIWIEKEDIDYHITIDKVGAGISQFIVFITHLMDSQNMIFCLDNSENHLHPHAQRKLLDLLEKYSENNQFIIITHSPNLIKYTSRSNLILVRQDRGFSIISQIKPNYFTKNEFRKLERDLAPEMLEIFFSDFVILVEGRTEIGALPILSDSVGKNFDRLNISIVGVMGKYFDIPVKLCTGFNLPYIVVCDRDALMDIDTHFGKGKTKIECSPIIRLLLNQNQLDDSEKSIIKSPKSIVVKGKKKKYDSPLFSSLREIAKKYDIFVLSPKFESILKKGGYTKYFNEITNDGVKSKPIIGKYVAEKIIENGDPIPAQFEEIINRIPTPIV